MIWPFASLEIDDLMAVELTGQYADQLADIHSKTFKHPWTDGDFSALLNAVSTGGVLVRLPYDRGGSVAGFVLVRIAADEAEVLTIAVDPKWQGRGVGRRLMDTVIEKLRSDGVAAFFLEVDESNKSAIALYKRLGFEQVAIRENYYGADKSRKSNALVMRRDVG